MEFAIHIIFLFAIGACVGSFLNVVIYRMPLGKSLITPPSHCPQCETPLAWYDNIPVFGWILLGGKCRYCRKAISPRYPIIEAITGGMFVFYYYMIFYAHAGPTAGVEHLPPDWNMFVGNMAEQIYKLPIYSPYAIYGLYMLLLSGLLAASLIDAELFIIPASIPWWIGGVAIVVHALVDEPNLPGSLLIGPAAMALCAGATVGLMISIALLQMGIFPISFPEGDLLEVEREKLHQEADKAKSEGRDEPEIPPEFTPRQVRAEMRKEMLFLMPPMLLAGISALLATRVPAISAMWHDAARHHWLSGALGALLGGIIGGFVVWIVRILGSWGFGREAMGLGDVHLMFGVGAVVGGGAATIAFFVAPFFGIFLVVYMLLSGSRRQLPFGPYLSLATAFIVLFYSPFAAYCRPGLLGLMDIIHNFLQTAFA